MSSTYEFISHGLEETQRLADVLGHMVVPGTVLALDGDFGVGKTAFSQALARAIGVPGIVNSPTFTIIKEYEGHEMPFYHMDVYRITLDEADHLGLDEYFYGDGLTLVEWAKRIPSLLPEEHLDITITHIGPFERRFVFVPHGDVYEGWCEALKENGILL